VHFLRPDWLFGRAAMDTASSKDATSVTLALCGDVMTGRGVDQILRHPGDPRLFEPLVRDARHYLELAEQASGPIAKPVADAYVWGDALAEWDRFSPDARIINLETSITTSNDYWRGKQVHYRMHPDNVACLVAARPSCCSLANNHVLDWGHAGLAETLQTLKRAGLRYAGAGLNQQESQAPVVLEVPGKCRIVVLACGAADSGIPFSWAATRDRPGINLLTDFSECEVHQIQQTLGPVKQPGDLIMASLHWGPNWGYEIPQAHRFFAHRLIDEADVAVVHGHSAHHVMAIEIYRDRLILHGCGDFIDDYEGITGYERFRDDLGLIYFATIECGTGRLIRLQMTPTQIHRMQVRRARREDALWLRDTLNRQSQPFGVEVQLTEDERLEAHPSRS
jgi:poly-gamma-glutamate synthesis protein (capsule biosynthesis protein)